MNTLHSQDVFWRPIVEQYLQGASALPCYLGLTPAEYHDVIAILGITDIPSVHALPAHQIRSELMDMRSDECQQIYDLLCQHISLRSQIIADEAERMAQVITAGCMSGSHLWHDLGLPERPVLTQLFNYYFPTLTQLNHMNMRWKRFLYKQLCETGGDYVCRAPSCDTCTSYSECFITEHSIDQAS
jgi:nitrogen fixation protein NifQ